MSDQPQVKTQLCVLMHVRESTKQITADAVDTYSVLYIWLFYSRLSAWKSIKHAADIMYVYITYICQNYNQIDKEKWQSR